MERFSDHLDPDLTFEIGGETFKVRYPNWTEWGPIFEEDAQMLAALEGDDFKPEPLLTGYERIVERIKKLYISRENGDAARFQKAVSGKTGGPVPIFLLHELWNWLQEETSGPRPTEAPTPSEAGDGATEVTSEVVSR